MEISLLLARIIGPLFCVVGLAVLLHPKRIQAVAHEIAGNPALLHISGACRLLVGLLLITFHNIWVQSWEVIITLIGWLAALKGAVILLFPEFEADMIKSWSKKKGLFTAAGVIALLVGLYLVYVGFGIEL